MDVLLVSFKVLRFCGIWTEREEESRIAWIFALFYRCAVVTLLFYFTISEVISLMVMHDDLEDVTECLFLVLTFVAMCAKLANFLLRQDQLSMLLTDLRAEICQSRDSEERAILSEYEAKARRCTLFFMALSQSTSLAFQLAPFMGPFYTEKLLPTKIYLPYVLDDPRAYLATYFLQSLSMTYGVLLNVSFDSLVYGTMILTCGQIDLLSHRISRTFETKDEIDGKDSKKKCEAALITIRDYARHHAHVQRIVQDIESSFAWTIVVLFVCSLVTLCTSIFHVSKKSVFTVDYWSVVMYLGCMLLQIFFYCWFGNELQLKSKGVANAIYLTDWTESELRIRKTIFLAMMIGQRGMSVSCYGVFGLALPTFVWIFKTSYSAFNLLQNVSN